MTQSRPISLKQLLLAATILASPVILMAPTPVAAQVAVDISVPLAPPELPVYDQPPLPEDGYIWTPGYWSWSQPVGYYWVPGTWVLPPVANVLWTPPYWGWSSGFYRFHNGYWGRDVGYYGGVDYGYGYGGRGYQGGRWQGSGFDYNRTVNNIGSIRPRNVYEHNVTVVNNNHVSYWGGAGGLTTAPTTSERRAGQEHHVAMTAEQTSHVAASVKRPDFAVSHNGGHPPIAASPRAAQFDGPGVVHAAPAGAGTHASAPPPAAEAKPGQPNEHAAARPEEHGAPPPADHALAPPPERVTPPAEHEAARPTAPPAQHEAARPPEPAPPQREAARPPEHVGPPPAQHEAARPAAAPPARQAAAQPERAAPPAAHAAPGGEKEKER